MIELTQCPIDYTALVEAVRSHQSGAVVLFLGTVRDMSDGKRVASLYYEAHPPLATKEMARIVEAARRRYSLDACRVVHRYGPLELGDVAVAVVAASMHRAEAFAAAAEIMEEIKKTVPIWKQETFRDATAVWVHPQPSADDAPASTNAAPK